MQNFNFYVNNWKYRNKDTFFELKITLCCLYWLPSDRKGEGVLGLVGSVVLNGICMFIDTLMIFIMTGKIEIKFLFYDDICMYLL